MSYKSTMSENDTPSAANVSANEHSNAAALRDDKKPATTLATALGDQEKLSTDTDWRLFRARNVTMYSKSDLAVGSFRKLGVGSVFIQVNRSVTPATYTLLLLETSTERKLASMAINETLILIPDQAGPWGQGVVYFGVNEETGLRQAIGFTNNVGAVAKLPGKIGQIKNEVHVHATIKDLAKRRKQVRSKEARLVKIQGQVDTTVKALAKASEQLGNEQARLDAKQVEIVASMKDLAEMHGQLGNERARFVEERVELVASLKNLAKMHEEQLGNERTRLVEKQVEVAASMKDLAIERARFHQQSVAQRGNEIARLQQLERARIRSVVDWLQARVRRAVGRDQGVQVGNERARIQQLVVQVCGELLDLEQSTRNQQVDTGIRHHEVNSILALVEQLSIDPSPGQHENHATAAELEDDNSE